MDGSSLLNSVHIFMVEAQLQRELPADGQPVAHILARVAAQLEQGALQQVIWSRSRSRSSGVCT